MRIPICVSLVISLRRDCVYNYHSIVRLGTELAVVIASVVECSSHFASAEKTNQANNQAADDVFSHIESGGFQIACYHLGCYSLVCHLYFPFRYLDLSVLYHTR